MRPMTAGFVAVAAGGFAVGAALAQSSTNAPFNPPGSTRVTLANKFAAVSGAGVNDAPLQAAGRTLEWVFSGSQISMFAPGARVVSVAFRNSTTSAGPIAQADFTDWSLSLARSLAAPGSLSSTISNNIGADSTLVRSGALSLIPGTALQKSGATAPFSWETRFDDDFEFSGGNLHLLLSQSGSGVAGVNFDAAASGDSGTNVLFQARKADAPGATATTESVNTPVTRLGVDAAIALPLLTATASNGQSAFAGALGPSEFAGQFVIGAEQLRHLPRGSLITWLTFRLAPGEAAWPLTERTTSDFEIEVATSVNQPLAMGTSFGSNPGADAIVVREGALTIPAGALPAGGGEIARFGMPIHFQRGFVYVGGDLCITVRHGAFIGGAGPVLDTANPAGAMRTAVAASMNAGVGAFLPQDASIALEVGYTPSLCVPNKYETVSGGSGAWLFETPRVHQLVIDPAQLTYLAPGSTVDGIAFRISPVSPVAFVSWPIGDATVNQFDVYLSTSQRTALQMSNVFSQNEGADMVRVRQGELFVPAFAMTVIGSDVGEHSFVIPFSKPFVYNGGGLCITMRIGQRLGGGDAVNFDGRFNTSGVNGKRATLSSSETSGNPALALATRLVFTRPTPTCPADLNGDGLVDDVDFVSFVAAYDFLVTPAADFNFDGVTDDTDFQAFVVGYDALVCP
ncbi:MAG: hypothetical protein ACREJD_15365 [Phycisphaerales bacterium]